jgi:hypothetical protein
MSDPDNIMKRFHVYAIAAICLCLFIQPIAADCIDLTDPFIVSLTPEMRHYLGIDAQGDHIIVPNQVEAVPPPQNLDIPELENVEDDETQGVEENETQNVRSGTNSGNLDAQFNDLDKRLVNLGMKTINDPDSYEKWYALTGEFVHLKQIYLEQESGNYANLFAQVDDLEKRVAALEQAFP